MALYAIIGVEPNANFSDLQRSFKQQALLLHPDKSTGSAEEFQKLNNAWQILSNPSKRAQYDKELQKHQLYQEHPINDELLLEDLVYNDFEKFYRTACRCGGEFILPEDLTHSESTYVVIQCNNCSLTILVELPLDVQIKCYRQDLECSTKTDDFSF